ncbi:MAG: hypothetical protein K8W52_19580 [Deltaproteobacteria bacterium]|nr:hypothetical protein [Deltaproteobacteria bacterium]
MGYEIKKQDLDGLSADQQVAIMESLVLAVVADHKTTPAETKQFEAEVNAVPWNLEPAKVMEQLLAVRTRIIAMKTPEEAASLINQVAERLPDPVLREKLFYAMGSIMASDLQMTLEEKNVLSVYVKAFGLTVDQVESIKTDIKSRAAQATA